MTVGLRLTDLTTTVTLSDGVTGVLTDYQQDAKPADEATASDSATVLLLGGIDAIQTTAAAVNRLIRQAGLVRQGARVAGPVYLERSLDGVNWWRTPVLSGTTFGPTGEGLTLGPASGKMEFGLRLERENFWEGVEQQAWLKYESRTNANARTVTVKNADWYDGATHLDSNRAVVYSGTGAPQIGGDLPAPTRLVVLANNGNFSRAWCGHGIHTDMVELTGTSTFYTLEAETRAEGGSATVDANANRNGYLPVTITTGAEITLGSFDITFGANSYYRYGMPVHLFLKFHNPASSLMSIQFRAEIYDETGLNLLASGPLAKLTEAMSFVDMGVMSFPPVDPLLMVKSVIVSAYPKIKIKVYAQQSTGSSIALSWDYLAILPADGWREVYVPAVKAVGSWRTYYIDDGIYGLLAASNAVTGRRITPLTYGRPIMLEPGRLNVLYWVFQTGDYTAPITTTVDIQVYYRERRLAL